MRRRLAFMFLTLLSVPMAALSDGAASPPPGRAAAINGELIAVPYEGHSGSRIFLSGGYLYPNTTYVFLMACPNWHDPQAIDNGNVQFITKRQPDGSFVFRTVTTDRNGEFVGFTFPALALHGVASSGCIIYGGINGPGNNPYGPEIPAPYFILPPGDNGKGCQVHMCTRLSVGSKRVRPGGREVYTVQGWPGATVHLSVNFLGTTAATVQKTATLNWEGTAYVPIPVPQSAAHVTCDRVKLQARIDLGNRYHVRVQSGPCFSVVD